MRFSLLRVSRQYPLHYPPDVVLATLDQQMQMVRHKAVGIQVKWQLVLLGVQQLEEFVVIFTRMKNVLAIVASRDHMIKPALDLDPGFSRHIGSTIGTMIKSSKNRTIA